MVKTYFKKYGGGNIEAHRANRTFHIKYHFDGKFAGYWTVAENQQVLDKLNIKKDAMNMVKAGAY
jgi:hypothetical protein